MLLLFYLKRVNLGSYDGKPFRRSGGKKNGMNLSPETDTTIEHRSVSFCPICGTSVNGNKMASCPRCGFNLNLPLAEPIEENPSSEQARIPPFAYLMLGIQSGAAGLLSVYLFTILDPYGIARLIAYFQLGSVIVISLFAILLQVRIGLTGVRYALFLFGMITVPLGIASVAASLAVHPAVRYCQLCGRRIAWRAPYIECPHCHGVFHVQGECITKRRERLANKWGRDPTGEEVQTYCPLCFTHIGDEEK